MRSWCCSFAPSSFVKYYIYIIYLFSLVVAVAAATAFIQMVLLLVLFVIHNDLRKRKSWHVLKRNI